MKKQDFKVLKTKDLYPFPDNPFHVAEDETLSELAESIKEFGIVTPIITRPKEDGVERFFIKDRDQKKKSDSKNRWMGSMMRVCCDLLHALFSLQTGL